MIYLDYASATPVDKEVLEVYKKAAKELHVELDELKLTKREQV